MRDDFLAKNQPLSIIIEAQSLHTDSTTWDKCAYLELQPQSLLLPHWEEG